MEKNEFINALSELINKEDALSVSKKVKELRNQFEDYTLEAARQLQIAELEATEKGEHFDEIDWIPGLKDEFYNLYNPFREKVQLLKSEKRKKLDENLFQKRQLIKELQNLIAEEENIGIAFSKHKEINEKWKTIGEIPRDARHEIQQEYSRLLEDFFYNMRIYKEIKAYDLEKNFETKKELISRLNKLSELKNIREVETELKKLQDEWEDIGPTSEKHWEEIKSEYWTSINAIYDQIRSHYDLQREKRKENLRLKKEIIEKMTLLSESEADSIKTWNQNTKKVLEFREEWKKIGAAPKAENEEIWTVFRNLCDQFFNKKSAFFEGIQHEFDKVAEQKKLLIDKVNDIKANTDWSETTKAIISLQKKWKNLGNAGQKHEAKLWKSFRAACDEFFEAKDKFYEEKDKAFEENLALKEALIAEIKKFELPDDKNDAIQKLKEYSNKFSAIGFVPMKEKERIYKSYKEAIYNHYEALGLKGLEKEKVLFEAKIDTLKGSGNSAQLFEKEKQAIRQEISAIKNQILQFENNLGFFADTKKVNPLKEQVLQNIKAENDKLATLKAKLKMIPNE